MALQQAQLGYMPTLSTPSGGGRYVKPRSPWEDLAVAIASQVAAQGVSNVMQGDYTSEAQAEGLPIDATMEETPWWKKAVVGPQTSRGQVDALRGQKNQANIAAMGEAGADRRLGETHTFQAGEGVKNRQAAVDLRDLDHAFQGGENEKNRGHQVTLQNSSQTFQGGQNALDRGVRLSEGAANRDASMAELDKRIAAEEKALGRRLTAEEQHALTQSIIGQLGKISMSANPLTAALINNDPKMQAQGVRVPSAEEQAAMFMELIRKQGFAPSVPVQ